MTIPTETSRMDYVGNGATTVYPYTFKIDDETELLVVTANTSGVETTLVLNTDYTVSGVGSQSGGNVTLTTVLASGYALTIQVQTTITQETDIKNQGAFSPEVIEDAFDHNIRVSQMISNSIGRAVRLPLTATGIDTTLANIAPGQFIRLSDAGTQLEGAQAFATLSDATQDGNTYGRKDGAWVKAVPDGLGWRNRIINGGFDISQRGTSGTVSGGYIADRWIGYTTGNWPTWSQSAGGIILGDGFPKLLYIAGVAGNTGVTIGQRIEAANIADRQGRNITLSAYVLQTTGAAKAVSLSLSYPPSPDSWVGPTVITSAATVLTSGVWTRVQLTVELPAGAANGIEAQIGFGALVAGQAAYVTGIQLEAGDTATPFEHRPYGAELALCQRYYCGGLFINKAGLTGSDITERGSGQLPVEMRVTPTLSVQYYGAIGAISGTTVLAQNSKTFYITAVGTGSSGYIISADFNASAEL